MAKRARQSFGFFYEGANQYVSEDDTYADDHPFVKASKPELWLDTADDPRIIQAPKKAKAAPAPT